MNKTARNTIAHEEVQALCGAPACFATNSVNMRVIVGMLGLPALPDPFLAAGDVEIVEEAAREA